MMLDVDTNAGDRGFGFCSVPERVRPLGLETLIMLVEEMLVKLLACRRGILMLWDGLCG